jgi:hypothetical protein
MGTDYESNLVKGKFQGNRVNVGKVGDDGSPFPLSLCGAKRRGNRLPWAGRCVAARDDHDRVGPGAGSGGLLPCRIVTLTGPYSGVGTLRAPSASASAGRSPGLPRLGSFAYSIMHRAVNTNKKLQNNDVQTTLARC